MTHRDDYEHDDAGRFSRLEAQLRSLPAPDVPDGLLDKLLRELPDREVEASYHRAAWCWLAGAAAAAAVIIAVFLPWRDSVVGPAESGAGVSLEYVLSPPPRAQESDPCYVFPPLPDLPHSQPPS